LRKPTKNQAAPLMGRAYLSERATGGAVEPSHIGEGRVGVDVSFVSFLCAKEKSDREVFFAPKKRDTTLRRVNRVRIKNSSLTDTTLTFPKILTFGSKNKKAFILYFTHFFVSLQHKSLS